MTVVRQYITPTIHVLVWILFGLLPLLLAPLSWQVALPYQFWIKQSVLLCLIIGVFYANAYVLVPKLLFQNKNVWFILSTITLAILGVYFVQFIEVWINLPQLMHQAFHPESTDPPRREGVHFNMFDFLMVLLVLGISTSMTVVQKWQKDSQLRQTLEREKVSSELSFLKAQINPHFFFNTLNNIYALTLINVDAARKALHKLSRMMRYVLYETPKDTTLLSQEIAFLQDYIALMQLRLTDKVAVSFAHPQPLNDAIVAPMLLLPFVENAFKHGISVQEPSCIRITIAQQGPILQMEVRNTIFTQKAALIEESSGIGLTNTKRRLDLLYPDRHTLAVNEHTAENEYQIHLTLDLS